ncbi:MAG: hypothetical protein EOO46_24605 [Flavobacterium sp.]|nr:MAG: hypothetical protein EOO46_24605 [Flavobacterium sp.]
MAQHQQANLYLDRDSEDLKHLQNASNQSEKYVDQRELYKHRKDLNDYFVNQDYQQKRSRKIESHF